MKDKRLDGGGIGIEAVEIVVIADRSGSMDSIAADAIGGFNAFLKEQRNHPGDATMTLVLFDHEYVVEYAAKPLDEVPFLDGQTFVPRGMTAMNDAIGRTLSELQARDPKKAVICIITDGQENNSREFTTEKVKSMIKAAEDRGWQVTYLAANQDAFAVASTLGVQQQNAGNFAATGVGVRGAFTQTSSLVAGYRNS